MQTDDGSTLRVMENRKKIDLLDLYDGSEAAAPDEAAVERIYADAHGIETGNTVTIAGKEFTVSGIVTTADYEYCLRNMSDMSADGKKFGTAFVTPEAYEELLKGGMAEHSEEYRYSYILRDGLTDAELKEMLSSIKISADQAGNLTDLTTADANPRIKAVNDDVAINQSVGLLAGVIVLVLITYVISVFIVHSIDSESSVIGALYALGVKRGQLILHYTMLPTFLCLAGRGVRRRAGRRACRQDQGYIRTFQVRQLTREKRSSFAVLGGMFVPMLILMLGLTCYALCRNIRTDTAADIRYEAMYLFKYPSETVPEGGYEAYVETLNKEVMGYDMEATVIGLIEENPFFPEISSRQKNQISISDSVAEKYGLSVGDDLVLNDRLDEMSYGFEVKEVVPYSAGLCVFMDIDSMRELWGQKEDYYNAVYADHELDVDPERLYSVSMREDAVTGAGVFMDVMKEMMFTLIAVAAVFGGIAVGYFLIRTALMRRVKAMTPAEVLKERE